MDANRHVPSQLLLAALGALAMGCATPPSPPLPRSPETGAALSKPEPDPACHGTVQGLLARNGLDTITVKVAVDASGHPELLDVLSPDITPAAKIELQRAFASCAWAPAPTDGGVEVFTTTWVRERRR